jgi:hypothetical protein
MDDLGSSFGRMPAVLAGIAEAEGRGGLEAYDIWQYHIG